MEKQQMFELCNFQNLPLSFDENLHLLITYLQIAKQSQWPVCCTTQVTTEMSRQCRSRRLKDSLQLNTVVVILGHNSDKQLDL